MTERGQKTKSTCGKAQLKSRKEVVERFLVHKMFKKWKYVSFGKHPPSDIRKYYEKKLLLRCLRNWSDLHIISSRKEWKMDIRAEYHNRYRIWANAFKAWKIYIKDIKIMKIKNEKAEQHAEKKLLCQLFHSLRHNVILERKKILMKRKADRYQNCKIQRTYWKYWLVNYNNRTLSKNMQYIALHNWAKTTKSKAFHLWKHAFLDALEVKQKIEYCKGYYNRKSALMIFEKWKEYVSQEKEKKRKIKNIQELLQHNIKHLSFRIWCKSYTILQTVKRSEEKVKIMGELYIKRRYLYYLMNYTCYRKDLAEKIDFADSIYLLNLKKKLFRSLLWYSKQKQQIRQQKNQAEMFHNQNVLSYYFSKWMFGCENQEDIKLYPLSQIAFKYYRIKSYSRVMFFWTKYAKEKRLKRKKYDLAVIHHNKKILPRCFSLWKDYIAVEIQVQIMNDSAKKFRSEILYAKYFYIWIQSYQQKEINIEMETLAVNYHNLTVLKRYQKLWITKTKIKLKYNRMEKKSVKHYGKNVTSHYLSLWRNRYQDTVKLELNIRKAINHHNSKLFWNCFQSIKKYHSVYKRRRYQEDQSVHHANRTISRKVFNAWKNYTIWSHQRNVTAEKKRNDKLLVMKRWAFRQWKLFVRDERWQKYKTEEVEEYYGELLKKKVFQALHSYTTLRIDKRLQDDECVIRAQLKLDRGKTSRIFYLWRECTIEVRETKHTNSIAENHFQRITTKKCLQNLKDEVIFSKHKKIMMADAMIFRVKHIMKINFKIWKTKRSNVLEERRKANLALVWWSYQLQIKVFRAMNIFAARSKQKKKDYQIALNFRRDMLIETGLVNWIQYANEAIERRRNVAYKEQMKQCMEIQSRVHKYALHWLRKTQRNKQQKHHLVHNNDESFAPAKEYFIFKMEQTANNYESNLICDSQRFKSFEVNSPKRKSRPSPRRPDYLRDSYDISTLTMSQNDSDVIPRNASWISSPHIISSRHPLQTSCATTKMLELTTEENDIITMKTTLLPSTLLPPSSFK